MGTTLNLDPKRDHIKCPDFGLYSSVAEYSTMGHVVLDLTYQPKSRERSSRPKKYVTFGMSEQKLAYAADTRDLEENDDEPLVRSDDTAVSDDEDDQPLVQPASRKNL